MDFIKRLAEESYRVVLGTVVEIAAALPGVDYQWQEQPDEPATKNKKEIKHAESKTMVTTTTEQDIGSNVRQDRYHHEDTKQDSKARKPALSEKTPKATRAMQSSDVSEDDDTRSGLRRSVQEPEMSQARTERTEQDISVADTVAPKAATSKKRNRPVEPTGETGARPFKLRKVNPDPSPHLDDPNVVRGEERQREPELHGADQSFDSVSVKNDGDMDSRMPTDQRVATKDQLRPFTIQSGTAPDFGDAPVRLVVVSDQRSSRTALLLNNGFVEKSNGAIHAARQAEQAAEEAECRLSKLADFRRYAEDELAIAPARWQALEGIPEQELEMQRIARESKTLRKKLERSKVREREIHEDLKEAERTENVQCLEAIITVEDIFLQHELIDEDDDSTHQKVDLDEDFAVPSRHLAAFDRDGQSPRQFELTEKEAAEQAYWARYDEVKAAEVNFARRKQIAREQNDSQSVLRGLRPIQVGMDLTRRLIEAEDGFAAAKAHAVQLGVHIADSELSSGFIDTERDGAESDISVPRNLVDRPRMFQWLLEIPEVMDSNNSAKGWIDSLTFARGTKVEPEDVPELDQWDGPAVALKDSTSMIADGSRRRRIDRIEQRSGIDVIEAKRHWGQHNQRGFTSEGWDRAHRLFETGR
ncbi:hypothetical protein CLAFUW4_02676 [Fulvia fulva]|uniref:Uncharacterized protein n=1 Tax=Passalora fulva TaxID=5499 RepID=A0A9Q8LA42_PASFU|nr:uncharacterized protein CLAFUR5_02666 [Fulvia fulva]KAK4631315.1 hypothetical protein CLAFUR4_02671 [Fulvia fulva]KAK4633748.1 hypothetical protein CLAFUR0_02673 [Fulvia fulva]UJO13731.1 hypothetical protein CLAFUR5_02666 [Fulvia fulva]WPV11657.1 hypothetical protein CLAFUW4_02676 [Fulvia fulva]WPV26239.1 hypothetical protein CLAFUW7_02675 [Fulvia fulva]